MDSTEQNLQSLKSNMKAVAAYLQQTADVAPKEFSAKREYDTRMAAAWDNAAEELTVHGLYSADRPVLAELITAVSTALLDLENRVVELERRLNESGD